ncbi:Nucleobase-ascorbate transporter 11 [Rhynchospora pubera]|uniref:Nucleobase-ascorbate transporter 11 n=1 Tax=Rhynchospora pubera TaxID=906938 RepID=A0AAV8GPF2_9POAL|nr:Nucleobase-ascorbate transporter 11 [Rhynchospora pubera]
MQPSSSSNQPPSRNPKPEKPGPWPPRIEPFVPRTDHNPTELKSWAKRTGFNPNSGDISRTFHDQPTTSAAPTSKPDDQAAKGPERERPNRVSFNPARLGRRLRERWEESTGVGKSVGFSDASEDLERGLDRAPLPDRAVHPHPDRVEIEPAGGGERRRNGGPARENGNHVRGDGDGGMKKELDGVDLHGKGVEREMDSGVLSDSQWEVEGEEPGETEVYRPGGLKCGVTENPGWVPLILYGVQHYLSMAGSLVFIPLIMVPAMGGSDKDTATVISTMLLITGISTILHTFFGTRLPLVQGSSFAYLAPALVIINSDEFRNLSQNKFKHIMRELQGAVIIGSIFQTILGYSGLMSLLVRLINPVVVAPTVAVIGLAFFSYGFPQAGSCIEISVPLIVLVLLFTLYMRRISLFGNRLFLVYAIPLSVGIVWAYAFFLTAGGAYNYKGCNSNIPSSNILLDSCRRKVETMRRCRTDVSNAWNTADWVRIPYPFQWGPPTFHFKTGIIMVFASLVASVDSVGSYHATALLVNLRPPTHGIVSRGIGLEGVTSIIAGLWGTGLGSSTLTENVLTVSTTKMASRRALQFGAILLILFSFFGKIGALLASVPLALAAAVLCFTWALVVALGLSTLRYTQTASSRNVIIVGFTLFISLSVPAFFQGYSPNTSLILPSYLIPYSAASSGPVHTSISGLNYTLNALLSINVVVAFLVAFILDNTVPGTKQERGVYIWSDLRRPDIDPASLEPYKLPQKICCWFRCLKCLG